MPTMPTAIAQNSVVLVKCLVSSDARRDTLSGVLVVHAPAQLFPLFAIITSFL